MKALILNTQVCQIEAQDFPVAEPLYWVDCSDDVTTQWTYVDSIFNPPLIPAPTVNENKDTAISLLQATDWTQIPSVSDSSLSNPYLDNKLAFDQYRNLIRQYAVYPIDGVIDWPTIPTENWVQL